MLVIICIDNNGGMMFNQRRQSRDSVLTDRILKMTAGSSLLMNNYSSKLFTNAHISQNGPTLVISENFLNDATPGDFCFVEGKNLQPFAEQIEKLIVYKWNRDYPEDLTLDIDLNTWTLISTADFSGSSHEKITEEIYTSEVDDNEKIL